MFNPEKLNLESKLRELFKKTLVEHAHKVPRERHWSIMMYETKTVYHEGDERSRTHPGHGYPAYTDTFELVKQHCFTKESEFKEAMTILYKLEPHRLDVVAFYVAGLIEPKVSFDDKEWEFVNRRNFPFEDLEWEPCDQGGTSESACIGVYKLSVSGLNHWGLYNSNRRWITGSGSQRDSDRAVNRDHAKILAYNAWALLVSK